MYPAVRVRDSIHRIIQDVILLETIRFQDSFELLQEFFRMLMVPGALIIVDYDRTLFVEFPGPVNPHVILVARSAFLIIRIFRIVIVDDLAGGFICLDDSFFIMKEFFLHQPPDRPEIFLTDRNGPVGHVLSGDVDTVHLKLLLDPVERHCVEVLRIQNRGHQGRRCIAVLQKILWTVAAEKFILMITVRSDSDINRMFLCRKGRRLAADTGEFFLLHPSPAAFPEVLVELFIRKGMMNLFLREILEVFLPFSLLLRLLYNDLDEDFVSIRLRNIGIGVFFCLIEKRHLACDLIDLLGSASETVLLGKTDLFDQSVQVLIRLIELILKGAEQADDLFLAEIIQLFRSVFSHETVPLLPVIIRKSAVLSHFPDFRSSSFCLWFSFRRLPVCGMER